MILSSVISFIPSKKLIVNKKGMHFFMTFSASLINLKNRLNCQLIINKLIEVIKLIKNNLSNEALNEIINIFLKDIYPSLSKSSRIAARKLYRSYNTKEFPISNEELSKLFGYKTRRVQEITKELHNYGVINKRTGTYFDGSRSIGHNLYIILPLLKLFSLIKLFTKKKIKTKVGI